MGNLCGCKEGVIKRVDLVKVKEAREVLASTELTCLVLTMAFAGKAVYGDGATL